ncbi:TetR/AcrR family transcriptional regulator [Anaeromyxobacter sp. Fw109-5]|uniref:TetR/AcrR family transcriptional regulator n=1 Tax=Anaeromyxobacter sp. (strain Fw109-5) TaxID=404589 RepID=UPI000158A431|nr:TetR/AcrR family transcriptional regulator [Anaeromyxobacter sp. Fw109-5]ABS25248.1 transcriptional regulator, TetR family [Anaeromyxobacter sp. Fw109-5]
MARPRSEDKRNALLTAAAQVIAELGVSAPTARIAQLAGVAEGTLFTYFRTKDELLNELYLALKAELRDVMLPNYPKAESVKNRARHAWRKYLEWGVSNPDKRKAMTQLAVSDRIYERTRAEALEAFAEVDALLRESTAHGALRDHPPAFAAAIMGSLAETTMDFIAREPKRAERYSAAGFEAFWNAVARA